MECTERDCSDPLVWESDLSTYKVIYMCIEYYEIVLNGEYQSETFVRLQWGIVLISYSSNVG